MFNFHRITWVLVNITAIKKKKRGNKSYYNASYPITFVAQSENQYSTLNLELPWIMLYRLAVIFFFLHLHLRTPVCLHTDIPMNFSNYY